MKKKISFLISFPVSFSLFLIQSLSHNSYYICTYTSYTKCNNYSKRDQENAMVRYTQSVQANNILKRGKSSGLTIIINGPMVISS